MQEQIIGFELAKLAKEKGFRGDTMRRYTTDNNILDEGELMTYPECYCHPEDSVCECGFTYELSHWNRYISAPTQALLQKWLREKHNIYVTPKINNYLSKRFDEKRSKVFKQWKWYIYTNINDKDLMYEFFSSEDNFETYEEALEEGVLWRGEAPHERRSAW